MRKKIIEERITKTEEQLLSSSDRAGLKRKRNKQLIYLFLAYTPLALILVIVFFEGPSIIYRDRFPYPKHEITEEEIEQFNLVAPYTCGFFFLFLTIFFSRLYLQTAAPLNTEHRKNKMMLLYIKHEKSEMAFLNKYYITTPIQKKQQVQIAKDDFYAITDSSVLVMEVAPRSQNILRL